MRSVDDGDVSLVLVLMAACSLFSMIGLLQLDRVVQRDLYRFDLKFSYAWAVPYWNLMNFIFAMGWLSIIAAIVFQSYLIMQRRKVAVSLVADVEENSPKTEIDQTDGAEDQNKQVREPREQEAEPAEEPQTLREEGEETPIIVGVSPEEF